MFIGVPNTIFYHKINLFENETVEIVKKLIDMEKLDNLFVDSSISLTIPTEGNNEVFQHYYDIDVNGNFNANINLPGVIDLDAAHFLFCEVKLEEVMLKENLEPYGYKITFFSKQIELKDKFGDDTLNMMDFSEYNYDLNEDNFYASIQSSTFSNGDIITPMIAYSNRNLEYGGLTDTYNIAINAGRIKETELRPSLKLIRIIEKIEETYDFTFSRDFFGQSHFDKLFMWMNGRNTSSVPSTTPLIFNNITYWNSNLPTVAVEVIDDDIFQVEVNANYSSMKLQVSFDNISGFFNENISGSVFSIDFIDADTNQVILSQSRTLNSNGGDLLFSLPIGDDNGFVGRYKFVFKGNVSFYFNRWRIFVVGSVPAAQGGRGVNWQDPFFNELFEVKKFIPSMKVYDFIVNIMKQFKLVLLPTSTNSFKIQNIKEFYSNGNILDLSNSILINEANMKPIDIYSSIIFKYKKTENVLGKAFALRSKPPYNGEIGYGDLDFTDASVSKKNELKIEVGFENMLFERLDNRVSEDLEDITDILMGKSIKMSDNFEFSPNDMAPCIFYYNGPVDISSTPIKIRYKEEATQNLEVYNQVNVSDSLVFEDVEHSLNFDAEDDPWHLKRVDQTLFKNYYQDWIQNIYSLKQRKIKIKAHLKPSDIDNLNINTRIIFGGNLYIINEYKIILNTGEVDFDLFVDTTYTLS